MIATCGVVCSLLIGYASTLIPASSRMMLLTLLSQAAAWIKATYANSRLCVKTLSEPDFMKHLELAIQFGNPFLFENVDEDLDPMLDPVLEKNVVQDGVSKTIMLGDKVR